METSYVVSYETGVCIQLTLLDAVLHPGEDTMSMTVSLIVVIERNAKNSSLQSSSDPP